MFNVTSSTLKIAWKFIASHTLAVWVLALITLAVLGAGTLPQSTRLSPDEQEGWQTEWETTSYWFDTLGISDIVGSWWFAALCVILIINMTAGTIDAFLRKWAFFKGSQKHSHEAQGSGLPPEGITHFIGGSVTTAESTSRIRGTLGLLGLPLAHLGIALIVLASFWRAETGFNDYFELSVSEVFAGETSKLQRRQPLPSELDTLIQLDRVNIEVAEGDYIGELQGFFSFQHKDGLVEQEMVQSNQPLRLGNYELHTQNKFGHSAVFERILPNGSIRKLYINFTVERSEWGKPWSGQKEQAVRFDNAPLYYYMTQTNSEPPTFNLQVNKGRGVIFDGTLEPGDVADLGAYKLRYQGMVPWLGLNLALVKNVTPIFVGFVMTLLGFLLHLLIPSRRVELIIDDKGWHTRAWVASGDAAFEQKWNTWCRQRGAETA